MSGERFINKLGDWDMYIKYYKKPPNALFPFITKSITMNCSENACGEGSFGKVFISTLKDKSKVAIKIVNFDKYSDSKRGVIINNTIKEATNLQTISLLQIPQKITPGFYAFAIDTKYNQAVLIMEFINGKTLDKIFNELYNAHFDLINILHSTGINTQKGKEILDSLNKIITINNTIIINIKNVIDILHSSGYVHYDLKPANIIGEKLPDGNYKIRLIDLGSVQRIGTPFNVAIGETPLYSLRIQATTNNLNNTANTNVKDLENNSIKSFIKNHRENLLNNNKKTWKVSPWANEFSYRILSKSSRLRPFSGGKTKKHKKIDWITKNLTCPFSTINDTND